MTVSTRNKVLLVSAVTLAALLLRAHNMEWGFPEVYEEGTSVEKAWGFWAWERPGLDLNPHFFNYPSFHFYIQFGVQALLRMVGDWTGLFPDDGSFRAAWDLRPWLFYLAGRWSSVLFASATVFVLFLAGWRVGGKRIALPAALFLVFHTVHIHKSRFVEVDVAMTFFAALSTLLLLRYIGGGRKRDLYMAGGAVGLAAATKYPAALFLLALPWAELHRGGPFRFRPLLVAAVIAAASFFAASPYVLLDFQGFLGGFGAESLHMKAGHLGVTGGGIVGAFRLFRDGFGYPLFLVVVAGLLLCGIRPRRSERFLVLMPALFFLLLATSRTQAPHYPMPVVPLLALLAAVAIDRLLPRTLSRPALLPAVAVTLLLLPPIVDLAAMEKRTGRGDTRTRAKRWIEETIPAGALVLREPHGPHLESEADRKRYAEAPEFAPFREELLSPGRRWYRTAVLPSFPIEADRSERFYRFAPYQWFDTIVLVSAIYDRYRENAERFPVQNEFYRFVAERYDLVESFPTAGGTGPEIEIYRRRRDAPPLPIRFDPSGAEDRDYLRFSRSLGDLYRDGGEETPAVRLFGALLDLRPDDAETLFRLGHLLGRRGETDRAIALFERSLHVDPMERQVRMNLGVALCQAGRFDEGIAVFREMLVEKEDDAEVHGNLASGLLQMGETGEAEVHFRRFLELAPEHARALEIQALLRSLH